MPNKPVLGQQRTITHEVLGFQEVERRTQPRQKQALRSAATLGTAKGKRARPEAVRVLLLEWKTFLMPCLAAERRLCMSMHEAQLNCKPITARRATPKGLHVSTMRCLPSTFHTSDQVERRIKIAPAASWRRTAQDPQNQEVAPAGCAFVGAYGKPFPLNPKP